MPAQLHIAALNITTSPPSSPEEYYALINAAFNERSTVGLRGDWVGMLGSCRKQKDSFGTYIAGDFYKYFDLNGQLDWFNLNEGKKAEPSDLKEISIPDNLKPHFRILPFVFFPEGHRLFFVTKDRKDSLSPAQAQRIVDNAVSAVALSVLGKDKTVEVIIEQSRQSLDAIFSIDVLRSLEIDVIPPNAFSKAEEQLLQEMGGERASAKKVILRSDHKKGLEPNATTRLLARLALSLGYVVGKGKGLDGKSREISTAAHPNIERHKFFPTLELAKERLLTVGRQMLGKILAIEN